MKNIVINSNTVKFNSHLTHNPECDILELRIDKDSFMTFGMYVKGDKKGTKFCEYYRGENYNVGSKLKSYSRIWLLKDIPVKYMPI